MATLQRSLLLAVGLAFLLSGCGSTATNEETLYAIGDTGPAGGLVFKVTDGGLHGMEMAPVCTPAENGHLFRAKADSDSGVIRTPIRVESGHFFRSAGIEST